MSLKANRLASTEFLSAKKLIEDVPLSAFGTGTTARREVAVEHQNNEKEVEAVIETDIKKLAMDKKRYLFGVSFEEVASEAMISLTVSRMAGSPQDLVRDMIFSVFVAYTVSRDWATVYNTLPTTSLLKKFEIDGRVVDRADPLFAKTAWVNSSKMNSTAVHYLGYLIVEAGAGAGVLGKLKSTKGTPFSDLKLTTPQGLLVTELAKTIAVKDKQASDGFKQQFDVLVKVVDIILGSSGSSLEDAIAKAAKMRPAEF